MTKWQLKIREIVDSLKVEAKREGWRTFFSISTTSKIPVDKVPYFSPKRHLEGGIIAGVVVFSQEHARQACEIVDGQVDYVLVDVEKKLPISFDAQSRSANSGETKSIESFEMGNISAIGRETIKKSKLIAFKPNDLTVDAAWQFASALYDDFSGKKISILGCGNIGFKLATKFVEAGANVVINRRDIAKGMMMANVINLIKPSTTLAHVYFEPDKLKACLFSDLLVATSSGGPIVEAEMLRVIKPSATVLDVGKGCIAPDALNYCYEHKIPIFRCDVGGALYGYVSGVMQAQHLFLDRTGRREITKDLYLVAGGALGRRGDLIVDDLQSPKIVYGIADGQGDLIRSANGPGFEASMEILRASGFSVQCAFYE